MDRFPKGLPDQAARVEARARDGIPAVVMRQKRQLQGPEFQALASKKPPPAARPSPEYPRRDAPPSTSRPARMLAPVSSAETRPD